MPKFLEPVVYQDGSSQSKGISTSNATPQPIGTTAAAAPGSGPNVSFYDHIHAGALTDLGEKSLRSIEQSYTHGLSYTPTVILLTPHTFDTCWVSSPPDGSNVYLTASSDSALCEVYVG